MKQDHYKTNVNSQNSLKITVSNTGYASPSASTTSQKYQNNAKVRSSIEVDSNVSDNKLR